MLRRDEEWEKVDGGAVLLLPPTAGIVSPLLHVQGDGRGVVKVAAFDMDDTLIKPASGGVFPKDDPADWVWVHPNVCGHLQHLHAQGFLIVLISNQMGISKGSSWNTAKADAVTGKVVRLSAACGVPLCECVATRDDAWRKPSPRLWTLLEGRIRALALLPGTAASGTHRATPAVECAAYSFYVGDAAGRHAATLAGRKKDFSSSDRQFAYNTQLPFFTPEQFFLQPAADIFQADNVATRVSATTAPAASASVRLSDAMLRLMHTSLESTPDVSWGDVSPAELPRLPRQYAGATVRVVTAASVNTVVLPSAAPLFAPRDTQEMILFVGYPGAGKSTFYERHLRPYGYAHVNRDSLQTRAKCLKATAEHWTSGRSVVVDNTNPAAADRQEFIEIVRKRVAATAKSLSAPLPVRIFVFTHRRELAQHMNRVRAQSQGGTRVPVIAYNVYQSRLVRPSTPAEVAALGIEAVWEVPAVACFDDLPAQTERLFFQLT